jgi:hypothetical protein
MAVSSTNTFTVTRNDIIDSALRTLGVIGIGETPTTEDYTNCSQALNIMIKSWSKKGYPLWVVSTQTINLVDGTASYNLGTRPVRIFGAYIRNTDNHDTQLRLISNQEYDDLGNKTTEGTPNQIYYDNQLAAGTVYVYPVPDATSADYTIYVEAQRMFYDMSASTDNFDFPQEWFQAIKWGLAAEIAVEYGVDIQLVSYYEAKSQAYIEDSFNFSVEEPSVYFTVNMQGTR